MRRNDVASTSGGRCFDVMCHIDVRCYIVMCHIDVRLTLLRRHLHAGRSWRLQGKNQYFAPTGIQSIRVFPFQELSWRVKYVVCPIVIVFTRPQSLCTKPYQAHNISVCWVVREYLHFCRFDKANATADVQ